MVVIKKKTRLLVAAVCSLTISFSFIGYSYVSEQQATTQEIQKAKKEQKKTPYLKKAEKEKKIEIVTKENKSKLLEQAEDTYYVYFYRNSCEHCKELAPIMDKYIKKYGANSFYFVNTDLILDDDFMYADTDDIDRSEIENYLISNSSEDHTAWMIEGTPTVFEIKNHTISKIYEGKTQIKALLKILKEEGIRS